MSFLFKKQQDAETKEKIQRMMTANEFVNVKDIKNSILYTKDQYLFAYLRIQPISLELLSEREQRLKGKQFSAQFSSIQKMYKLFSISRPVDVSAMLENLRRLKVETTDRKRKEVMQEKIKEINQFALSGEILEHQFYMILWEQNKKDGERELLRSINEATTRFKSLEMDVTLCKDGDIVKLLNLFANANYAHLEDEDLGEYVPFVL